MKLQIVSDLHIEVWPAGHYARNPLPVTAPYLALCGDIGDPADPQYAEFLHAVAAKYCKVFVVLGNHEHYGRAPDATRALVQAVADAAPSKNLHLMDRTAVAIPEENVVVLGCTLWSEVLDEQRSDVGCFIADYRRISGWTVEANNWRHRGDVQWLEAELHKAEAAGQKAVVLTHHAPVCGIATAPHKRGGPLSSAFETDLRRLLKPPVALWACGHTHHSFDVTLPTGTRVVANQMGYPREDVPSNPAFHVEV